MRQNAASAATWTLVAFAVQLVAAVCVDAVGQVPGMVLMLACWLMNAYAAFRLRCWVSLAAAFAGAALVLVRLSGADTGALSDIAVNLFFLLYYLPLERGFDEQLRAADVSEKTLRLGRTWALMTLIQRGASMMGFLPYFEGQDVLSVQQGSYTTLFCVQLGLEVIALLAAVIAYIWMVRYLWRARVLLNEEGASI